MYHCASKLGQANSKAHQIDLVVNSEVGTGKISIGRKRGRKIKQIQKLSKPAPAKKENENGNFSEDEEDLHDSEEAETSTDENDTDADNFNVIQDKKEAYSSVEEQPYTSKLLHAYNSMVLSDEITRNSCFDLELIFYKYQECLFGLVILYWSI